MSGFLLLLVLLGLLVPGLAVRGELLAALASALRYYSRCPGQVSNEMLFGLLHLQGQLYATRLIDKDITSEIDELIKVTDSIVLNHPTDWLNIQTMRRVSGGLLRLKVHQKRLRLIDLNYRLEDNLIHGSPAKDQSSECILEAIAGSRISRRCYSWESHVGSRGYTLSHQAIYFSLATAMGIHTKLTAPQLPKLCNKMLSEIDYVLNKNVPEELTDLFIEEVAVCGMNNFKEFLTRPILDTILGLQKEEGCFALKRPLGLRECDEHLSSVSIVALGSFLYSLSETRDYNILTSISINE